MISLPMTIAAAGAAPWGGVIVCVWLIGVAIWWVFRQRGGDES